MKCHLLFFPFLAKGAGLADFIQPGLIQLQPNLDDFMDTLEPLHGE
jgi:MAX-like protein X